jgi:hypothetical protein
MKKFFTLIACALVAGSAFADDIVLVKQVSAEFSRKSNDNVEEMAPFKSTEWINGEQIAVVQSRVVKDPADADLSDRLANWCIEVVNEEVRTPKLDDAGEQVFQNGSPQWDNGADWDAQFFISLPDGVYLEAGTEVTFKMRVKAKNASIFNAASQAHLNPGGYKHWDMIGSIAFTTEWVDFEKTWTVANEQDGTNTIAINLACDGANPNVYYFDDIEWTLPVPKVYSWKEVFSSDGTDATPFSVKYFRNYTDEAKVVDGAIMVTSLDPEKDYSGTYYYSDDADTEEQPAVLGRDWDTQFLIPLGVDLAGGKKFKITFKYKADKAATAGTQVHTAAPAAGFIEGANHSGPGTYIHYQLLGDFNFTTEWQTYNEDLSIVTTVPSQATEEKPMGTVCFNLEGLREVNNYYFDDIKVYVDEEDIPTGISSFKAEKATKTIYNVAGQQIKSLQKGLNIVNGEKVYVK